MEGIHCCERPTHRQNRRWEDTVLTLIVILVVVGTAIWVDQDARKLLAAGATRDQLGGNSPLAWSIFTILLWIIVFPWYLVKRGHVKQELAMAAALPPPPPPPPGPLPNLGWYVDPTNALQQRYWDGHSWTTNVRVAPPQI
jgi:hypothetical protein